MVPSIDAVTPLPAVGVPLVWSPGQAAAHAPAQADWFGWSFSNRYRVRPLPSTRIMPRLVLVAETVAPLDAPSLGWGGPPPPHLLVFRAPAPPPIPPPLPARPAPPAGGVAIQALCHSRRARASLLRWWAGSRPVGPPSRWA